MVDILYAALVTKIGINDLVPGEQYRITDYQTTYYIYEYANSYPWAFTNTNATDSGSVEPIIVTALTDTILSLEAKSEAYPGDTLYFTVDNVDAGVFASATGTITRRVDGINKVDMSYDYRAIKVTYNSTDYYTIPSSAINVRIGGTISLGTGIYEKTIPILITTSARNVDISIVNDATGIVTGDIMDVKVDTCIRFGNNIGGYVAGSNGLYSCTFQTIDLLAAPGDTIYVRNFIGGYLSNLENKTSVVCSLNNPSLYNSNTKIGIPGGYFVEMGTVGTETKCTYTGDFIS